ncbi:PLP-dependent aminotransferase family protein [Actinomadura sp. HBU206391]|uniref:MocR-like pyridoxine biosynthesis transcription factor PdxR n=1 Tax=Actinomadura sp. HBU206391 TaxID=2731692 RepID=UPI001650080D|nr:PLP-dependent aminotransferase family protein [Actinomadura sp. HBU206391]MBC6457544.1 PLP-dependent aminotransferase family protein [Actinomadura sp. HBU206391]
MTDLHLHFDRAAGRMSGQVAAGLRAAIRGGRLAAGSRLPSSRDLARDLGVSRGVVVAAYEQLLAEGFLVARRGDGTRVGPMAATQNPLPESRPGRDRRPARDAPPVSYDLRPGVPDLAAFPRERWSSSIRAALRALQYDELGYPDPAGAPVLRAELAGQLGRVRAAHVTPERVVVTQGVAHGLAIVVRLLAEDGHRRLAVEDPASVHQVPLLEEAGVELVRVPVDGQGVDVTALDRTGARAVLVTPAHQYPTGVVLSARRRAELVSWARAVDGIVIEDDYDAEFRYDREPVGCLQGIAPDRVVLTGSVSKSLAPALRLGWVVAPRPLAERVRAYRAGTDLGGPVIEQHALAELIASGSYDRHLRVMRRQYRLRRDALVEAVRAHLPGCRVHGVSAGLHVYVELPVGMREQSVVEAAGRMGVAVDGAGPLWWGPAPSAALVLGYAALSPARLARAMALVGSAVTPGSDG